jgi:hypothetical protein
LLTKVRDFEDADEHPGPPPKVILSEQSGEAIAACSRV